MKKEESSLGHTEDSITLVEGHAPEKQEIQFTVGPYQVLREIGKGGMGEVFLAYDTLCGRRIALKKIRADLLDNPQLHNRFLKEAHITSQLTHPAIIPIYAIHRDGDYVYYTMPFVEGETLKQILRKTREQEKKGEKLDHLGGSIPALIRMFIPVCQAVAYAHAKHVLHRDLKPENVIIGPYGEILILDWGLAKLIKQDEPDVLDEVKQEAHPLHEITRVGKVVGTVSYMAPERALGHPATCQTDIYSLGVMLYQILTLRSPFHRGSLKEFRQNMGKEELKDPNEVAPYRDVPRILFRIVQKCLDSDPHQRYLSVDELIRELENFIEGRSEWFQIAEIDIDRKSDWEFQENVLIAEHIAITRSTDVSDWVNLMISKASFSGNTKVEVNVRVGEQGNGIGFLMSMPEVSERVHLNDGYCLWLGTDENKSTKLLRSTVEVMDAPEVFLMRNHWYRVRIEKVDYNIYFYLNDVLQFSYISHIPLTGTHIGVLLRDDHIAVKDFTVFVGSQNVNVNCLAVPDAFLTHKDYATALSEYRRIGYTFPGRAEGREAMFRAGVTFMEQARQSQELSERERMFDLALDEFAKLHNTPGAPLEYLGKSLVYRELHDYEEEIKCFELACRRYLHHPLLPVLEEQIMYRLHDTSRHHRKATYRFILLVVRHIPKIADTNTAKKLFSSLEKHWEALPFIEEEPACETTSAVRKAFFSTELAFWLAKPHVLGEVVDDLMHMDKSYPIVMSNALFSLIELGAWTLAKSKLGASHPNPLIEIAILCHEKSLEEAIEAFSKRERKVFGFDEERVLLYLIQCAIDKFQPEAVHRMVFDIDEKALSPSTRLRVQCSRIWAYLLEKNWEKAGALLNTFSDHDQGCLHFLYGCWLYATGEVAGAEQHFSRILDQAFPKTPELLGYYLNGKIRESQRWFQKAFLWEKRQLYKQLILYYHCIGDLNQVLHYRNLEKQEYVHFHE